MKKIIQLICALGITLTGTVHAEEVFLENFNNPGSDTGISIVDWHVNYGPSGIVFNESNKDISVGPIISSAGFLTYNGFSVGEPILIWTDKNPPISPSRNITNVTFSIYNQNGSINLKVAFRVDDLWYVSQDVFNATGSWTGQSLDVKAASWNRLTFNPGSLLSEGDEVGWPSSGTVTAVGIFDAAGGPSGYAGRVRFDNFAVNIDPSPTVLRLVIISN
jgi:hypothetical protein